MKWFKSLFTKKELFLTSKDEVSDISKNENSLEVEEVSLAKDSNDFDRMLMAVDLKGDLIDRHFLLQTIVEESYKKRDEEYFKNCCLNYSEIHLSEFDKIAPLLKEEFGVLPRVTVFQNYATLLTELNQFDKAINVCQMAINFGLKDGTKGGFEGRIERIKKKSKVD